MGRDRTLRERLEQLLPDPTGSTVGYVVTVTSFVDGRGITQWTYTLAPGGGGGGTGTVTNVSSGNLSPLFTVAITNPTTTPAFAFTQVAQAANLVFAGPSSGGSANPTFRALVASDLPAGTVSPLTTKGDIWGYSTVNARVPVGTDGNALLADSAQALGVRYGTPNVQRAPGCVFSNGGLTLSGTLTDEIPVPYGGTITAWTIVGDVSGSASIAVSHSTYAAYDTMTSLFTATCTTAKKAQTTGISFAVSAGDVLRFSGSGFANFTRCSIVLTVDP